ncbi:MAG TPA: class A beta-lactamase [Polyangiaceae bacterium]
MTTPPVHPRRHFLLGSVSLVTACAGPNAPAPATPAAAAAPATPAASVPSAAPATPPPDRPHRSFADIEAATGARLGVFAVDTANERQLAHRADERFALCSTFKWVLAAWVLAHVERGTLALDERVPYGPADLLEYAPAAKASLGQGFMTVEALAVAAVAISDNTAANLLLAKTGGPAGLTEFIRSCGDTVTRLDRLEPDLNDHAAGDLRDTTSPRAMTRLLRHIICGDTVLSASSRERLLQWLRATETGKNRLRAGFPPDWSVGNKTGSCMHNSVNDVAIATPPDRPPVIVAVYLSGGSAPLDELEGVHAEVARLVAQASLHDNM